MRATSSAVSSSISPTERLLSFVQEIRKPSPYRFGLTEGKGVLNIIVGVGTIVTAPCFKCFRGEKLYDDHVKYGTRALRQGVSDLRRAMVVAGTVSAGLAAWQWSRG